MTTEDTLTRIKLYNKVDILDKNFEQLIRETWKDLSPEETEIELKVIKKTESPTIYFQTLLFDKAAEIGNDMAFDYDELNFEINNSSMSIDINNWRFNMAVNTMAKIRQSLWPSKPNLIGYRSLETANKLQTHIALATIREYWIFDNCMLYSLDFIIHLAPYINAVRLAGPGGKFTAEKYSLTFFKNNYPALLDSIGEDIIHDEDIREKVSEEWDNANLYWPNDINEERAKGRMSDEDYEIILTALQYNVSSATNNPIRWASSYLEPNCPMPNEAKCSFKTFFPDMISENAVDEEKIKPRLAPVKKTVKRRKKRKKPFVLEGRTELNTFFNESVIDIVNNPKVYAKFGIGWPEPFILEGPPGCGKTYAVKKLEEYLDLPTFHITSSSVGSSYIHETAKRIEETFNKAAEEKESMIVIDEMESFVPNRASSEHRHEIEEVNAFLKCLQTAQEKNILVVGMTNFIDRIDPAILRTGRMGTHIKVSWPTEEEITKVFEHETAKRPLEPGINLADYASNFLERPLSDVAAVVRRASLVAAHNRAKHISKDNIEEAIKFVVGHNKKEQPRRQMGFCM